MDAHPPSVFDSTKPHSARVWNYWLGGKDHFPVDREFGDRVVELYPEILDVARASRAFLGRAVRHLAGEVGIRQFLDVGTGLPTVDNTHDVAQRVAPETRVVYVDNDPLVLVHARALLTGTTEGATSYIEADVRDPEKILDAAAATLDFSRPITLMLMGIMGLVPDNDEAYAIVRQLVGALPPGSYLVLEDGTRDIMDEERFQAFQAVVEGPGGNGYHYRTVAEVARFFDGLDLLEPGIVSPAHWRPDADSAGHVAPDESCAVARKP